MEQFRSIQKGAESVLVPTFFIHFNNKTITQICKYIRTNENRETGVTQPPQRENSKGLSRLVSTGSIIIALPYHFILYNRRNNDILYTQLE